jgi:hypothetical protein
MANRWAVATGNWSDTATWNGGTLPAADDDVFSGGFTVTIDQDVTVLSLRNAAASGITVGGGFTLTGNHAVTCTGIGLEANAVNLLTYDGNGTANIDALLVFTTVTTTNVSVVRHEGTGALNVTSPADIVGGNGGTRQAIVFSGTGTLNVTANIRGGTNATARAIHMTGGGQLTLLGNINEASTGGNVAVVVETGADGFVDIVGNITCGPTSGTANNIKSLTCAAARTTITITGNILAGPNAFSNAVEILSAATGSTVSVTGNVTAGQGTGGTIGVSFAANCDFSLTGNATGGSVAATNNSAISLSGSCNSDMIGVFSAGPGAPAVAHSGSAATIQNYIRGTAINNGSIMALYLYKITWGTQGDENLNSGLNTWTFFNQLNSPRIMYRPDQFDEFPAATDVALGVSYGPNDEIVGTLVSTPTPEAVAGAVWGYARTGATTSGSMGERLKDAATVATTGAQIAGFGE